MPQPNLAPISASRYKFAAYRRSFGTPFATETLAGAGRGTKDSLTDPIPRLRLLPGFIFGATPQWPL